MKHDNPFNYPLIRTIILMLMVLCLSSCALKKAYRLSNYEDFADISNTIWSNLYFKINKIEIPHYKQVLYKDTRWRKKHSPIILDGSVYVLPGVSLTIDPGVTIKMAKDVGISCNGLIIARGTAAEPIIFTRLNDGEYWNAIECNNALKKTGSEPARVMFENCVFEYGHGVDINSSDTIVSSCVFRYHRTTALRFVYASGLISGNRVYGNSTETQTEIGNGCGINIYTNKTVRVENNEIYENASLGGRDGGGGIYAFAYDEGQVTVTGNTVRNNTSDYKAGGIFAYAAKVTGNTVIDNRSDKSGGGIHAIESVVSDNVVSGNRSNEGGGVYSEHCELSHNLIKGNTAFDGSGFFHIGGGVIQYNTVTANQGTRPERSAAVALSGNPFIEDNNIVAPNGYAVKFLSHSLSPDLKADNNYWGTTDQAVIDELICDWMENTQVGLVSRDHFRSAPVEEAYPETDAANLKTGVTASPVPPGTLRGMLESDTFLGRDDAKRYAVTGNLLIREGALLDIAPGCELTLAGDVTIRVRGQLTAAGEAKRPIKFTGDRNQPWGHILFENRSLDADDQSAAAQITNIMQHCLIENGQGVLMDGYGADLTGCTVRNHRGTGIRIKEVPAAIKDCLIQDNTSDSDGGGIYVYGSKRVLLHNNRITGNTAADGGGIFAYGYRSNVGVDIRDNQITGNISRGDGGGIWTSRTAMVNNTITGNRTEAKGGGVYASFALVEGNRISRNTAEEGGGVYAEANSSLTGNTITDNNARGKLGGGVYLNFWGLSPHNKLFTVNTVEKNTAQGANGTGGVVMSGESAFGGNIIAGNSGFQLNNRNPAEGKSIIVKDCYWGTTETRQIEDLIYDGLDDPSLSVSGYTPFARTKAEALSKIVVPEE
ncbi:MAG: right-handed parallel beta-helix repeat-containing protein [Thermodesulfobacteriota bacterium]